MNDFKIESTGIYNSQIALPNTVISQERKTLLFELELPIERGGVSYVDGVAAPIETDLFICAKPRQTRCSKFPYKCFYAHLYVSDEYLYETLSSLPSFIKIKNRAVYEEIFKELYELQVVDDTANLTRIVNGMPQITSTTGAKKNTAAKTAGSTNEILAQSLILKLIYTLRKEADRASNGTPKKRDAAVERALSFIEENLAFDLSLEAVAKKVSVSPIRFHNRFKSVFGKTLRDYVEEERIKKSVHLMLTTDMTLSEIAYQCGFSSQSYFNYVFLRRMKITPRKYARELNERYEI